MEHLQKALTAAAQAIPPWVGVVAGHLAGAATLQNAAYIASIVYSAVTVWAHFRKAK